MRLHPLNNHLVIEPIDDPINEEHHQVLIPEGIEVSTSGFKVAKLLAASENSSLKENMILLVPSHMIEEATFFDNKYYLILENYVVGHFEN